MSSSQFGAMPHSLRRNRWPDADEAKEEEEDLVTRSSSNHRNDNSQTNNNKNNIHHNRHSQSAPTADRRSHGMNSIFGPSTTGRPKSPVVQHKKGPNDRGVVSPRGSTVPTATMSAIHMMRLHAQDAQQKGKVMFQDDNEDELYDEEDEQDEDKERAIAAPWRGQTKNRNDDEDDEDDESSADSFGEDTFGEDEDHEGGNIRELGGGGGGDLMAPTTSNTTRRMMMPSLRLSTGSSPHRGRDLHDAFVAKEAARTANCVAYCVLIALFLVGTMVCLFAFFYATGRETADFEANFDVVARQLVLGVDRNAHELYERLQFVVNELSHHAVSYTIDSADAAATADADAFSTTPSSLSSSSSSLYTVTIPEFEKVVEPIRQDFNLASIVYAPWLTTASQRLYWESYSVTHALEWIQPSSSSSSSWSTSVSSPLVSESVIPYIWTYDEDANDRSSQTANDTWTTMADTTLPSAPMWMGSPPPSLTTAAPVWVNYNLNHDMKTTTAKTTTAKTTTKVTEASTTIGAVVYSYERWANLTAYYPDSAIVSEPINITSFYANSPDFRIQGNNPLDAVPYSVGIIPVVVVAVSDNGSVHDKTYDDDDDDHYYDDHKLKVVIGHLSAAIPWTSFLSNILQPNQNVTVVVNSCNNGAVVNTFQVNGPEVVFVGSGDSHKTKNSDDQYAYSAFFYGFVNRTTLSELEYYCKHQLTVYPTVTYQESFESSDPILFAVATAAVVAFAIVLFISYDSIFRKQQHVVLGEAERSNAIVASLFPGKVARRLFLDTSRHSNRSFQSDGDGRGVGPGRSVSSSVNLINFMNKGQVEIAESSRPIAELFPDATVLFADIAGFTAWSSIREPSQVFLLLESIFQAFDNIAKSFGVFKVETVGDCYMACCGVPEPNEDHATVMAQFARECLRKFKLVVQELELKLGPDTGDLALRTGMNSGPVTAGVLRGERARFQLFGDTVNTAARMESTGVRNRIQLSEQTAFILIAHGRKSWVTPREDKVEAKGKGILSTYWLEEEVAPPRLWQDEDEDHDDHTVNTASGGAVVVDFGRTNRDPSGHSDNNLDESLNTDTIGSNEQPISSVAGGRLSDPTTTNNNQEELTALGKGGANNSSHTPKVNQNINNSNNNPASNNDVESTVISSVNAFRKKQRLVDWNTELLMQLLKHVVARRFASAGRRAVPRADLVEMARAYCIGRDKGGGPHHRHHHMPVDEVLEIIVLPDFDERASYSSSQVSPETVVLSPEVTTQCRNYVALIASMYRDNPFHNFEHASHVTMSVSKLLSRIVAPELDRTVGELGPSTTSQVHSGHRPAALLLHDHTYGITSDPLTQFAVVLSALIHDVDHRGVPNFLLIQEEPQLAATYCGKSVAEQNSVDLAWEGLMRPEFGELRSCIFSNVAELKRFRALLINSVIATDIFDKELGALRKNRWAKAFAESPMTTTTIGSDLGVLMPTALSSPSQSKVKEDVNRKATIVIEHLIQASDVAHTMQHWHVYTKWNERLFQEMYQVYKEGRSDKDPSTGWYQGELGFFDHYIIPLAKKLKECGVFGVASDEYLNYAMSNRREWEGKGLELVANMIQKYGGPVLPYSPPAAAVTAEAPPPPPPPLHVDEENEGIESEFVSATGPTPRRKGGGKRFEGGSHEESNHKDNNTNQSSTSTSKSTMSTVPSPPSPTVTGTLVLL